MKKFEPVAEVTILNNQVICIGLGSVKDAPTGIHRLYTKAQVQNVIELCAEICKAEAKTIRKLTELL